MKTIFIFNRAGAFAENKDVAQEIRLQEILPAFDQDEDVTIDFEHVSGVTQSFIHALISDVLRKHGQTALDHLFFKSCHPVIQQIIAIVIDYMQESMGVDTDGQDT